VTDSVVHRLSVRIRPIADMASPIAKPAQRAMTLKTPIQTILGMYLSR